MPDIAYRDLAKMLDHSLLQPTLTDSVLEQGLVVARDYDVASVCIKPYSVARAREILAGRTGAVGTTIGFPRGSHVTGVKVAEAEGAMNDGALELDMVVNIGQVLCRDWRYVSDGIGVVIGAAHARKAIIKVIFE